MESLRHQQAFMAEMQARAEANSQPVFFTEKEQGSEVAFLAQASTSCKRARACEGEHVALS